MPRRRRRCSLRRRRRLPSPPQPAAAAAGRSRAGGKTPKLVQDTAMHEHLQKPVDPGRLASSKVHTVTMPLLAQP